MRFHIDGDKRKSLNGWYIFYTTPVFSAGFGSWKTNLSSTWTFKSDKKLTHAEKLEYKRQVQETKAKRKAEQEKRHKDAEKRALAIWNRSRPAASPSHAYVKAKRMGITNIRQLRDSLVIPLYQGGKITSLQFIDKQGNKKFLSGGRIKGSCFIYGDIRKPFDTAYIAESPSTGHSVHVLSDYAPVFCAMNAGNLEAVAVAVRAKLPNVKNIIIAADNDVPDKENGINIGVVKAKEAARACGGSVSIPHSVDGNNTKIDWNDLHLQILGGVDHD